MKTFICRTSQATDVANHLDSYYPHEFVAEGTKVFCTEHIADDAWLNEIQEHAKGYFQGIVDTLASPELAALRAENAELREALTIIVTSAEYMRDRHMPTPSGIDAAHAVLAKYPKVD